MRPLYPSAQDIKILTTDKMASSPYTQASWEIFLNVQLGFLTIAILMAICVGTVRWTENMLKLEPNRRRNFGLLRLTFMIFGASMLVWSQVLLRGALEAKDALWQSTIQASEGCGIALGAMLLGQVMTVVGILAMDRYKKLRGSVEDVEQQQGDFVVQRIGGREVMIEIVECVCCRRRGCCRNGEAVLMAE
ncbi:hypothetical protein LTR95_015483 [Oleoguttula sp. CCFEE 5521]